MTTDTNLNKLIACLIVTFFFVLVYFQVGWSQDATQVSPLYMPGIAKQQPTPIPVLPTPKPTPTFPPPPSTQMRGRGECRESYSYGGRAISAWITIVGETRQFEVVYSHNPDGEILGKVRGPSSDVLFTRLYDLVDADWWVWVRDGNGNRISELVKIHTDSTLGPDKCQDFVVTFWGDPYSASPPGPYGVRVQDNQNGTYTARWFFSDKYVGKIQGFRIHQIFLRPDNTTAKTETVVTVLEPWRREFSFTPLLPLTCHGTNYGFVKFSVSSVFVDQTGQETTVFGDDSLVDKIACQ